ncbi:heme anaerobic degradation radical SAM methyltransferase ChuW/HutW [Candidatus Schmidhempelia bombi]|jgi:anaerobilin synthase|uniref:Heme anaerobic degradation radical SAM methyltransferase ChuW/HutW n=1 Tax=Candidatus Schmidhempelia bombi str. Bimp TaxID=1387197 RepID=A0AB94IF63_9GAMM|nr:heme anaerobic degradation radical SAM methyltransferase ChuW/HutW [Candidatus Schmidhempelia bombi]TEA28151.1 heme anaerobic degradation radical SAM methyltransferase ChuW/HutW [Candidatus Schmidhempelia bombi str. Bimp]
MTLDLTPFYAKTDGIPFTDRWAVMPFRGNIPIDKTQVQRAWQSLQQTVLPKNKRLLYIHIPFCATHCQFCGFYQNPLKQHDTAIYTEYLIQELSMDAQTPLSQSAPIHAVYFGGGTPTALRSTELHRIITTIKRLYPLAGDCEITIEGRILGFDSEKIAACIEAGANRFSIGIQTFNTEIRQRLARTSDKQQAINFIRQLAEYDQAAVVCDLIFGLPRQTVKTWQEDLEIVRDLPLDGVDLYALNLLPTTPLFKGVENGRIQLPDVSQKGALYRIGVETLDKAGWIQLSNSHFGRTTRERNCYNLLIKQGADYLAFGSCAGGKLNGQSFMIDRNLAHYYQQLDQQQKPIMMMFQAAKPLQWLHQLQGMIEAGRLDLALLTPHSQQLMPLIKQWYQVGLLTSDERCTKLTIDGRYYASNLLSALQHLLMQLNESTTTTPTSIADRMDRSSLKTR